MAGGAPPSPPDRARKARGRTGEKVQRKRRAVPGIGVYGHKSPRCHRKAGRNEMTMDCGPEPEYNLATL